MADALAEFLRGRKQQAGTETTDWAAKKDVWIRSVASLYGVVESMLQQSVASNDVSIRKFDTQVTEELVGTYSIPVLELTIGNERVEFQPKGLTVIGASGRVDILGARDRITLLQDHPEETSSWSVVLQRVPQFRTAPLSQESLKYALERVMLPLL